MKRHVEARVREALKTAAGAGALRVPPDVHFAVDPPIDPAFGDLACDVAQVLARRAARPPEELAAIVVDHFDDPQGLFDVVEPAGPGFINVRFSRVFWRMTLRDALDAGSAWGTSDAGAGRRVQVACVRDDATGPLDVADGRGAVVADVCARLLGATGFRVERTCAIDGDDDPAPALLAAIRADLARFGVRCDAPAAGAPPVTQFVEVVGAERDGQVARRRARLARRGLDPALLRVVVVAGVDLMRGGQPLRATAPVSARAVVDEVGSDATRFFFLAEKADGRIDFDLELAKHDGTDNPLFWVQYAHARIAAVLREAAARGRSQAASPRSDVDLAPLGDAEVATLRALARFPDVVETAARNLEPHRLALHAQDLAGAFHRYYNRHRILTDDPGLTQARLALAACLQSVLRASLGLAGVSAPERM